MRVTGWTEGNASGGTWTETGVAGNATAGTGIRFFPYVGRVVGHPCLLRGSIEEVVHDARRAEESGVDGINLLAYRYDGDVDALVEAVVEAISLPVIAAGSVDSVERIRALSDRGVWAFTIGTAALDGRLGAARAHSQLAVGKASEICELDEVRILSRQYVHGVADRLPHHRVREILPRVRLVD